MVLQGGQQVVPEGRLLRRLDLREVEDHGGPRGAKALVVRHHVEDEVHDGGRESRALSLAHVPVVEVEPAASEDFGREAQLGTPVVDDLAPEESLPPPVHLASHLGGRLEENRLVGDGEFEVPLVVEGHGLDLAERVLPVEHPPVGPREQRVRHVAEARLGRCAGFGSGPRTLDPLPLEVSGDLRALEVPVPRILHPDGGARDEGVGRQELDPPPLPDASRAPRDARGHDLAAVPVQGGEGLQSAEDLGREEVGVGLRGGAELEDAHQNPPSDGFGACGGSAVGSSMMAEGRSGREGRLRATLTHSRCCCGSDRQRGAIDTPRRTVERQPKRRSAPGDSIGGRRHAGRGGGWPQLLLGTLVWMTLSKLRATRRQVTSPSPSPNWTMK